MSIQRNVSGQRLRVFAWDTANSTPKTGDAANITAQITKDYGSAAATDDTNPTEVDATDHPGVYEFTLTQAETNADRILVSPVSSTADISLDPVEVFTVPARFTGAVVDDASNSASTFETDRTESTDDYWVWAWLRFTSGSLIGQVRRVTDYNGTTKFVTTQAFTAEPAAGDTFELISG
jgi:hypothetical protein